MFRPPFLARVAAGAAVYALEETRRLPTAAINFPITAISQLLQTSMHVQQFVTSLALKGDAVFDRLGNTAQDQPEWATFDEDLESEHTATAAFANPTRTSRFDLYTTDEPTAATETNGYAIPPTVAERSEATTEDTRTEDTRTEDTEPEPEREPETPEVAESEVTEPEVTEPEVARRYDYANMTLAQLRARLRMLSVEELTALLDYEQRTWARAPFVTMLTNRIATVRAQ
ncbi:lipid droplet-associated protein [Nocardia sp. NPDC005366]|uniref:lipid droplet-associated protein n=1 Tax=Nocardia sp. NPDC005366 TaxID=3156878 RepID=UPI0033B12A3F